MEKGKGHGTQGPARTETEAETMARTPEQVEAAERLDDAKAACDALELMADAFLSADAVYNEHETVNAMHRVIDAARADIAAAKAALTA